MRVKKATILFGVLPILLLFALSAGAEIRVTKMAQRGTMFHNRALKSQPELAAFVKAKRTDIQTVLSMQDWQGSIDDLITAVDSGNVTTVSIAPGTQIPFLAMRRKGKPDALRNVIWAGKKSFDAFRVQFESKGRSEDFYFPKVCANFWFVEGAGPSAEPPGAAISISGAGAVCVSQPTRVQVNIQGAQGESQVQVAVDGKPVNSFTAGNGSREQEIPAFTTPGTYTVTAQVQGVSQPATATITVRPCPPVCALNVGPTPLEKRQPIFIDASGSQASAEANAQITSANVEIVHEGQTVQTFDLTAPNLRRDDVKLKDSGLYTIRVTAHDSLGQTSNVCEAPLEVPPSRNPFFIAVLAGKERLVQDDFLGGRCAPLVGIKGGILPEIAHNLELELSVGGKINTRDSENSSIFVDAALNGIIGDHAFIGGGVSFWDLTEDDTRTVAALVQTGFDLSSSGKFQLVLEARAPFDQFDDLGNNYMFWGGIRIRPGR